MAMSRKFMAAMVHGKVAPGTGGPLEVSGVLRSVPLAPCQGVLAAFRAVRPRFWALFSAVVFTESQQTALVIDVQRGVLRVQQRRAGCIGRGMGDAAKWHLITTPASVAAGSCFRCLIY